MSKNAVATTTENKPSDSKAIERTAPVEPAVQNRGNELAQRRQPGWTFSPSIDVWDAGSEWVLITDVPGADAESIEITCEDRVLTLRADVQPRTPEDAPGLAEYRIGSYHRTFRIGEDIDPEAIGAEFEAGVLTLHMPKVEHARPRRIPISAGQSAQTGKKSQ